MNCNLNNIIAILTQLFNNHEIFMLTQLLFYMFQM